MPGYVLSAAGRYAFETDSHLKPADGQDQTKRNAAELNNTGCGEDSQTGYDGAEGDPVYATAMARSQSNASSFASSLESDGSHVYSTAHGPDSIRGGNHVYARANAARSVDDGSSNHVYSTAARTPHVVDDSNNLYSTANHGQRKQRTSLNQLRSPPVPGRRRTDQFAC